MRRRQPPRELTRDDLPARLRTFTGSTPGGWSAEYAEWSRARSAWCRGRGLSVLDVLRREVRP
jgi:hypothetical protein